MLVFKPSLFVVILLSICALPTVVVADNYLGLAVGQTDTNLVQNGSDVTRDGTSLEIRAGRSLFDIFALEVGYVDFGDMEFAEGLAEAEISGDAYELALVAHYPASETLKLIASIGVSDWESSFGGAGYDNTYSDNGTDLVLGVGLNYRLSEKFSLDLRYKDYDIGALDEDLGMDSISIGIKLSF